MARILLAVALLAWLAPTAVTQTGLHLYWDAEAKKRGWVVISPAAPEGTIFYRGAENELANLLEEVSKSVEFEGGKVHLAGVSNGGLSAYRVITENPGRFLSLTVLPGVPLDDRPSTRSAF